jgi:hypothetical protein
MVIGYFNLVSVAIPPHKTQPPLVIDPDAVLPPSIARKGFKMVSWRNFQVFQSTGLTQEEKFTTRNPFDVSVTGHPIVPKESFGVALREGSNHPRSLSRVTLYFQRYSPRTAPI